MTSPSACMFAWKVGNGEMLRNENCNENGSVPSRYTRIWIGSVRMLVCYPVTIDELETLLAINCVGAFVKNARAHGNVFMYERTFFNFPSVHGMPTMQSLSRSKKMFWKIFPERDVQYSGAPSSIDETYSVKLET